MTELSQKDRVDSVLKRAFALAYEDNPARTEWPLHPIDADFDIRCPEDIRGDVYYMGELYLTTDLLDEVIGITEALPAFLDTYLSGRTSLDNLLHVYTPENLDRKLTQAELVLSQAESLRDEFMNRQASYENKTEFVSL